MPVNMNLNINIKIAIGKARLQNVFHVQQKFMKPLHPSGTNLHWIAAILNSEIRNVKPSTLGPPHVTRRDAFRFNAII